MSDTDQSIELYNDTKRREKKSRRVEDIPTGSDQRKSNDRRVDEDRRGFYVNLVNPIDQYYEEMIAWLLENGRDEWTIGPNDNEPENSDVTCRVRFETKERLDAFITWLDEKKASL